MSAAKTKIWKPIYEHYRAKGLSSTATRVILARRIARTAWSIYTHKTEFDPKRLSSALTYTIESMEERRLSGCYVRPWPLPAARATAVERLFQIENSPRFP